MSKLLITTLAIIVLSHSLSAQLLTIRGHEIGYAYFGPKVGTTFSSMTSFENDYMDYSTRMGYQIGAVGELGITQNLGFQTEMVFTSKGAKTDFVSRRVNYLSIPLLAKFSFSYLGLTDLYAMGGTYNNVRIHAREVYTEGDSHESSSYTDHYKIFDWGLSLGVGAGYELEQGIVSLDLRYDLGITGIERDADADQQRRNRSFGVAVTYRHNIVNQLLRMRARRVDPDYN